MSDSKWVPIRDEIEKYAAYGARFFFPVLATVAPIVGLPVWVGTVAGALIPQLMTIAENNSPAPGSGPAKKQQVLNAADEIMAVLAKTFTGGALANFDKLRPTIETLIDQTVAAVNALAPKIIASDGPPTQGSGIAAPVDSP